MSESDHHEVGVSLLTLEPKAIVEFFHFVGAVECGLVTVQLSCKDHGYSNQELAELPTPVLVADNHVLHPPNLTAAVDKFLLHN